LEPQAPRTNGHRNGHEAAPSDAQAKRVAQLKRAYQKQLRAHPTTIQRQLMTRAAVLTAKAEAAALDPNVSLEDVVRLDNVAARARGEMAAALHRPELGRVDLNAVFDGEGVGGR
jgi:hypothetical protein